MKRDRGSKFRFLRHLLASLKVTGNTKNLPEGGVLVVVAHSSVIDPFFVYLALRKKFGRKVSFMAAAGLWKIPIVGFFFWLLKFIPVYRKSDNPAAALAPAEKALRAGKVIAMYAEGGIPDWEGSHDQPPSKFRTGAARLWAATGVPVLPIAQLRARRVMSGSWWKQALGLLTAGWRRVFYSRKRSKLQVHVHFGDLIVQKATGDLRKDTEFLQAAVDRAYREAEQLAS